MPNLNERRYHHGDLKNTIIETAMDMLKESDGWAFTLREVSLAIKYFSLSSIETR